MSDSETIKFILYGKGLTKIITLWCAATVLRFWSQIFTMMKIEVRNSVDSYYLLNCQSLDEADVVNMSEKFAKPKREKCPTSLSTCRSYL